jgi:methylase of polypeptide subunit release factors
MDYFPGLSTWDASPFRARLRRGGFHREPLESLGLPEHWLRSKISRAALLGRCKPGSPLDTLIRLFTLGDEVDGTRVLDALGDTVLPLLEMGFMSAGGGNFRSLYQICPVLDSWIACDFASRQAAGEADHTMGVGPSTLLLASLTPPPAEGSRILELGCGIGWLSQQLARQGHQPVATDLNARALALGRFTLRLSDAPEVDYRQGDGFAPVAGETFDLILSNPPYVQSPGGELVYREAPEGDPICARLLREAPAHLAPGGIAVVLLNWSHGTPDEWSDGPLSWVEPQGVRRWLFQTDCSSPADYAWKWIEGDIRFGTTDAAAVEMARWLEHYQRRGTGCISGGFMVLEKCEPGEEWTRCDSRDTGNIAPAAGAELLRVLQAETRLAAGFPVLDSVYSVPAGLRAEAVMSLDRGGWQRQTLRLTSPARLSYDGQIDENILRLLELAHAGEPPSTLLSEVRQNPEFAAIKDLEKRISGLVEDLIRHGILIPPGREKRVNEGPPGAPAPRR